MHVQADVVINGEPYFPESMLEQQREQIQTLRSILVRVAKILEEEAQKTEIQTQKKYLLNEAFVARTAGEA